MFKQSRVIISKTFFVTLLTVLTVQSVNLPLYAQNNENEANRIPVEEVVEVNNGNEVTSARRQFLFNLGFNDVSKEIRERLKKNQFVDLQNRRQMIDNVVAYEVQNAARELSLLIMEAVDSQPKSAQKTAEIVDFAAKMLALKPSAPPTDYPTRILNMEEGEAKDMAIVEWLAEVRAPRMTELKNKILSDVASVMFNGDIDGKEKELVRIDKLLNTIVDRMYYNDTIGKGKYLGRTFAALLAREDVVQKRSGNANEGSVSYTKILKKELLDRYNLHLENFIGDTMVTQTTKGVETKKIKNGMEMITRNLSAGSLQISWAAIPKDLYTRWKARFKGIIGTPFAGTLYVEPHEMEKGITLWMRFKHRLAQWGPLREGYSHIVYFEVKEDPSTGIKMFRVIDNYPNIIADITQKEVRSGGTRITFLEQVLDPSHHSAFFLAEHDAEKFSEWFKQNEYKEKFGPAVEVNFDNVLPEPTEKVTYWETKISREDFERLRSEKNPKKLLNESMKRFVTGLYESVIEGMGFHWPNPNKYSKVGAAYCSETGYIKFQQYVGISVEQVKTVWHWSIRAAARVAQMGRILKESKGFEAIGEKLLNLPQVKESEGMVNDVAIKSPGVQVMQPYVKREKYLLEVKTPEQQIETSYAIEPYLEKSLELTRRILAKIKTTVYDAQKVNHILSGGAAIGDVEYAMVKRGSRKAKPMGIDLDRIAEKVTELEIPKVLREQQKFLRQQCQKVFKN